jgi:t-SNARE complex subunit (syntaxin)
MEAGEASSQLATRTMRQKRIRACGVTFVVIVIIVVIVVTVVMLIRSALGALAGFWGG